MLDQQNGQLRRRRIKPEQHINETLIFMVQHVDESRFSELFERCKPLFYRSIRKRFIRGYDQDDLWQEACECFVEATRKYERDRGMSFSQYVSLCLDNHFNRLSRWNNALKRKSNKEALSLDGIVEQKGNQVMGTAKSLSPSEWILMQESMAEYQEALSGFEKIVSMLYMSGYNYDEIATSLRCSREKAMNAKHRCSQKYKELFFKKSLT